MTLYPNDARRRLQSIHAWTAELIEAVPRAITVIHEERNDGYPRGTNGNSVNVTTSSDTTTVEAATITNIDRLDLELEDIDEHIAALSGVIDDILDVIRPRAPRLTDDERKAMRCSGGVNLPGAIEWSNPTCTNIAAANRRGMCDACYQRERRWARRMETA